jgi:hypothetical protein
MHGDGYAVFSGTVSLENNGGFASVRVQARSAADLSEFKDCQCAFLATEKRTA